jgi:hypothetical protein
VLLLFV